MKQRGNKFHRCGAKRPVAACAGTRESLCQNIFFDAGRNWAFCPTAVEFNPTSYSAKSLIAALRIYLKSVYSWLWRLNR